MGKSRLQRNGDVFAFDAEFNKLCSHGIPNGEKDQDWTLDSKSLEGESSSHLAKDGLRLSVIIWAVWVPSKALRVPTGGLR